jgi:hypothetical protein
MKAKEYAQRVLDESLALRGGNYPDAEAFHKAELTISLTVLIDVMKESRTAMGKLKSPESVLGAWRELLTKWKSVVRQVQDKDSEFPIADHYLGAFVAKENPELYMDLVNARVFLGVGKSKLEEEALSSQRQKELDELVKARFQLLIQNALRPFMEENTGLEQQRNIGLID